MIEIPSKAEFRAWLAERPTETVGYACNWTGCPFAEFLQEKYNTQVSIYRTSIAVGNDDVIYLESPLWLKKFIADVDIISGNVRDLPCDGDFCISILDRCE